MLKLGHSFSIDEGYNEKILDRSEFWNGNRFDYFGDGAGRQGKLSKPLQENPITQSSQLVK